MSTFAACLGFTRRSRGQVCGVCGWEVEAAPRPRRYRYALLGTLRVRAREVQAPALEDAEGAEQGDDAGRGARKGSRGGSG